MPRKVKFTKEQVIEVALNIIRKNGPKSLTARSLAKEMNGSSQPIFTLFKNMEEVQNEVLKKAYELYTTYVDKGLKENIPFKGVGMAFISFATHESKLFQLLFMSEKENIPNANHYLSNADDDNYNKILNSIMKSYDLNKEDANRLYFHLNIYTHGIATLCATKSCTFTIDEISNLLSEEFISILTYIKSNKNQKE